MSNQLIGGMLAVLGVGLLVDAIFPIPLPLFKIAFALTFVYFGVRFLKGAQSFRDQRGVSTILGESHEKATSSGEYATILSHGILDLTELIGPASVDLNVVLGEQIVRIPKGRAVEVRAQSVFASVHLPDGMRPGLGTSVFRADGADLIQLQVAAVFASLRVEWV